MSSASYTCISLLKLTFCNPGAALDLCPGADMINVLVPFSDVTNVTLACADATNVTLACAKVTNVTLSGVDI